MEKLGELEMSVVTKKPSREGRDPALDFLGKEGTIHTARIKECNSNLSIIVAALQTLGPPIVGYF